MVTMSQKSSVLQPAKSVSQALTPDSDSRAAYTIDCCDAGADRASVQMDRACATECHAAAELCAGHAEHVTQHPQERGVTVDVSGAI